MHVHGYEIVRRDRNADGRLGGGVCFYVRSSINYSTRHDLSIGELENLCIEIRKPRSKPFLIVTWYRPPDSLVNKFIHLETLVGRIDAENIEYYLMGDMNCDLSSQVLDHNSIKLMNIADLYSLHQLISDPTRITISSSTMIDLIFTNTPFNSVSFRSDICSQNWDDIKTYDNPNEMWHVWKDKFNIVVEKHAPLRSKRVRASKSPWITPQLKQSMHEIDLLKIKATRSNEKTIKRKRNAVNNEIKEIKRAYYLNEFRENENNSKQTWNIINELTSRKHCSSKIKEINLNSSTVNRPQELSK